MEETHEEFGRQQLDDQNFEPEYDPAVELDHPYVPGSDEAEDDDPFAGKPHGELQGLVDHLERSTYDDDPADFDVDDFD